MPTNEEVEAAIRATMTSYEYRLAAAAALLLRPGWEWDHVMHVARDMTEDGSPAIVSELDPRPVKRRRRQVKTVHPASAKRFTWLSMTAIDLLDGTPLRLLAQMVALGGKAHCLVTYTQTLATMLQVDRKSVQRGYPVLEAQGFILIAYDKRTQQQRITILPKAYPPAFQRTVKASPWPVDPRDVNAQRKEGIYKSQRLKAERFMAADGATLQPHIKTLRLSSS